MPSFQYTPYTLPLVLDALLCIVSIAFVWRRQSASRSVLPFIILFVGVIEWTLTYAIDLALVDPTLKAIFEALEFAGIATIPATWLIFILTYIGQEKWVTRRNILLLAIEPVLVVLVALTNDTHHLFWATTGISDSDGFLIRVTTHGILFWVHAAYSYVLLVASVVLMLRAMLRYPTAYRGQVIWLLIGLFLPWVANAISIFGTIPVDVTPFAFTLACLAFGYSLLRYRLFDVIPIARESVIESMKDAMLVLDPLNRIVDINPAAIKMTGRTSSAQVIGKTLTDLLPGQAKLFEGFQKVTEATMEIVDPNSKMLFELQISPLYNSYHELTGRIIMLRNINEIRRIADQVAAQNASLRQVNHDLILARKQADDANALKSQFLATMSHELRTPLNAVIGYAQLMAAGIVGDLTPAQMTNQERILVNSKHLLKLINEVLDLSRIEAGRMDLVQKPYAPRDLLAEVLSQSKVLADEKGLKLTSTVDDRLPPTLIGDPGRLQQILINLLSNAVKFTEKGDVRIEMQWQSADSWKIAVVDTGIGIAPHLQETIFEEFRQIDGGSTRQYGGSGLGLAIVRRLVLIMGGSIRVTSQVEQGSTFTITLPLITETAKNPETPKVTDLSAQPAVAAVTGAPVL